MSNERQLHHGENKLHFDDMSSDVRRVVFLIAHCNNSPRVDMSLHSDRLFRANQSLLLLLSATCLAKEQQI
jgi:hypothetical protein